MKIIFVLFWLQVSKMYHDVTIGNAVNIVLVRVMYLEEDDVSIIPSSHSVAVNPL